MFSSDRDGNLDIYTMEVAPVAATGNQPLRLTDSPEIDSKPDRGPSLYGPAASTIRSTTSPPPTGPEPGALSP